MATDMFTAGWFADRSYSKGLAPAVINITMPKSSMATLFSNGAKLDVIGGANKYIRGKEISLSPSTFSTFDSLRSNGRIHMRLMPMTEWDIPLPK